MCIARVKASHRLFQTNGATRNKPKDRAQHPASQSPCALSTASNRHCCRTGTETHNRAPARLNSTTQFVKGPGSDHQKTVVEMRSTFAKVFRFRDADGNHSETNNCNRQSHVGSHQTCRTCFESM